MKFNLHNNILRVFALAKVQDTRFHPDIGKCPRAFAKEEKKLQLIIFNHRPFSHVYTETECVTLSVRSEVELR